MYHTGGLNVFTLPLLMLGGRVILPRRFDPAQALRLIQTEKPTVLFLVPTMFRAVTEQPSFAEADLSHVRWAISGSDELSMLGWCIGATLATLYAALRPEGVRNLVLLTAPLDFSGKKCACRSDTHHPQTRFPIMHHTPGVSSVH